MPWRLTHLFFISVTIVMNAWSTLVEFLALVSKNGIPSSSANAFKTGKKEKDLSNVKVKVTEFDMMYLF